MVRALRRIWLSALLTLVLPSLFSSRLIAQETERTYWQAVRRYYDASDGWETYKTCRTEMGQPLKYSESAFKRLPITDIDTLAREAKRAHGMYQRYSTAMDNVGLKKRSRTNSGNYPGKTPTL